MRLRLLLAKVTIISTGVFSSIAAADDFFSSVNALSKTAHWQALEPLPLTFPTHHPQGLVKIGEHFFLSSVEVTEPPQRYSNLENGFDRSPGAGIGHLFKIAADGSLVQDLILGEGTLFHPGGIDYDGDSIWVSVAEYRPDSRSIVYKVDPDSISAVEIFRFDDHLGGILRDPESDTLYGISWGSRKIYQWQGRQGIFQGNEAKMQINGSHYIDYQDCQWIKPANMFCSGLSTYNNADGIQLKLGGLELINLSTLQTNMQLPVTLSSQAGTVLTQNPFYSESLKSNQLLFYFVPDDDNSSIYRYRVTP